MDGPHSTSLIDRRRDGYARDWDGCEWDPEAASAATDDSPHFKTTRATVLVGAKGQWRLCASCAERWQFAAFKKRTPLR